MRPRRGCGAGALALALILAAAPTARAAEPPALQLDVGAAGWPVPDFELHDARGEPFGSERLLGQWTFVLLGDLQCAAPCEAALAALAGLQRRLAGTAKRPQVLFVALEPGSAPPATLAARVAAADPAFIAGGGALPVLARLADELVPALAPAAARLAAGERAPYHSGALFLVGPDGALRAEFRPPYDVPLLTAAYLKLRLRR